MCEVSELSWLDSEEIVPNSLAITNADIQNERDLRS